MIGESKVTVWRPFAFAHTSFGDLQVWLELGLHLALVGKLATSPGRQLEEGIAALDEAHDILSVLVPPRVEQW